jgi:hypothetical protein
MRGRSGRRLHAATIKDLRRAYNPPLAGFAYSLSTSITATGDVPAIDPPTRDIAAPPRPASAPRACTAPRTAARALKARISAPRLTARPRAA